MVINIDAKTGNLTTSVLVNTARDVPVVQFSSDGQALYFSFGIGIDYGIPICIFDTKTWQPLSSF